MITARKLIAVLCLVAVLWAAITPASSSLLWAVVIPILLFFSALVVVTLDRRPEQREIPTFSFLTVISSRAPPVIDPLI